MTKSKPDEVSGAALARLLAIDERTVRKLADAGTLARIGRGRYDRDASITRYVTHLRDVAGRRHDSTDAATAHARYKLAQAERAELEVAERSGRLVERHLVSEGWQILMRAVAKWSLGLPGEILFALGLPQASKPLIEKVVRDGLHDLALNRGFQIAANDGGEAHCDRCGTLLPTAKPKEEGE
jgi:hypothetical protein